MASRHRQCLSVGLARALAQSDSTQSQAKQSNAEQTPGAPWLLLLLLILLLILLLRCCFLR